MLPFWCTLCATITDSCCIFKVEHYEWNYCSKSHSSPAMIHPTQSDWLKKFMAKYSETLNFKPYSELHYYCTMDYERCKARDYSLVTVYLMLLCNDMNI